MDGGLGDVFPERGVVRALMFPAHLNLSGSLGTEKDGALSVLFIDGVDA